MSDSGRRAAKRRSFLKATGAMGAIGLTGMAGCLGMSDDDVIRFILNPAEAHVDMDLQYKPLIDYLEEETGATIETTLTESYTATVNALRNDQGELADISPTGVIAAPDHMDVIGIRVAFGAAQYFSLITTLPDNDVDELADLEGRTVSLVDPLSVSGGLFPLLMLKQAGLDVGTAPDGDPVDFEAIYSDHTVAREELVNRVEVYAAGNGAFASASYVPEDQFSDTFMSISSEAPNVGTDEPELQLLAESDPIPRAPLVSRSSWDNPLKDEIEDLLINAPDEAFQHEDEVDDDHELWFTGVEPGTVDDYQPIQDVLDELDLEFGDI